MCLTWHNTCVKEVVPAASPKPMGHCLEPDQQHLSSDWRIKNSLSKISEEPVEPIINLYYSCNKEPPKKVWLII